MNRASFKIFMSKTALMVWLLLITSASLMVVGWFALLTGYFLRIVFWVLK
jgi:hypothetical protein